MATRYDYTLSGDFSGGISTINLTSEINTDLPNKSFFISIVTTADAVRITFSTVLSGPEQTQLNATVAAHNPNPDLDEPEATPVIETSTIQASGPTGTLQVEGFNFQGGQITPVGPTAAFQNITIDANNNNLTNIDNNNIKALAAIDATKLANGAVSNIEYQYLDGVTSNIQTQIDNLLEDPSYFHAYDSTGGVTFTTAPVTVVFNTATINTGEWSLTSGELTALATETYLFIFDIGTEGSSGTARSTSDAFLELNTGSGFSEIIGTRGLMYNRLASVGDNSTTITRILDITTGDQIRARVVRHSGSDTLSTRAFASRVTIVRIKSSQGPQGPPGIAGADGDITWEGNWIPQNYTTNQAVAYLGSSYVCRVNTVSNELPTNTSFWDLLAAQGATGAGSSIVVNKDDLAVTGSPFSSLNFKGFSDVVQSAPGTVDITINFGVNHYGASATNPVVTPSTGDKYFNTVLNQEMFWDASRSKWLSTAIFYEGSGLNGSTSEGVFYRRFNGMALSLTLGPFVPLGTIVSLGFNNANSGNHTYEVLVNGSTIATLASGGSVSAYSDTLNADFPAGVMSSRNQAGSATTNNFQGTIQYRLRSP